MKKGILKDTAWGISPLGGNSVEGTGTPNAEVRDSSVQAVPLVYDPRVGNFISEQAVDDLDDRDDSIYKAKRWEKEAAWRAKAGVRKSIEE